MVRRIQSEGLTTAAKVQQYESTRSLIDAMYSEIQELAKKKPEAILNATKVKMINRLLSDVRLVLETEPQVKYLDLLNDEDLPQYSDVVLVLSQYVGALDDFHDKYFRYRPGGNRWVTEENP